MDVNKLGSAFLVRGGARFFVRLKLHVMSGRRQDSVANQLLRVGVWIVEGTDENGRNAHGVNLQFVSVFKKRNYSHLVGRLCSENELTRDHFSVTTVNPLPTTILTILSVFPGFNANLFGFTANTTLAFVRIQYIIYSSLDSLQTVRLNPCYSSPPATPHYPCCPQLERVNPPKLPTVECHDLLGIEQKRVHSVNEGLNEFRRRECSNRRVRGYPGIMATMHSTLHSLYLFFVWAYHVECVLLVQNEKKRNPRSDVVGKRRVAVTNRLCIVTCYVEKAYKDEPDNRVRVSCPFQR